MPVTRVEELRVYRRGFTAAMQIFEASKAWPAAERYALTDQVRRSSRAVCANLAEAWRKRRYPRHFVSKLSDADAEAAETRTWLRFAHQCGYLDAETFADLDATYDRLIGGLVRMMHRPEPWCGPAAADVHEPPAPYAPGASPALPLPHAPALTPLSS
jgi:four helix bundle protein